MLPFIFSAILLAAPTAQTTEVKKPKLPIEQAPVVVTEEDSEEDLLALEDSVDSDTAEDVEPVVAQ